MQRCGVAVKLDIGPEATVHVTCNVADVELSGTGS